MPLLIFLSFHLSSACRSRFYVVSSESMSEQSLSGRARYGSTSSLSSAATASSPCTAGIPVSTIRKSPRWLEPLSVRPFHPWLISFIIPGHTVTIGNANIDFACDNNRIQYIASVNCFIATACSIVESNFDRKRHDRHNSYKVSLCVRCIRLVSFCKSRTGTIRMLDLSDSLILCAR